MTEITTSPTLLQWPLLHTIDILPKNIYTHYSTEIISCVMWGIFVKCSWITSFWPKESCKNLVSINHCKSNKKMQQRWKFSISYIFYKWMYISFIIKIQWINSSTFIQRKSTYYSRTQYFQKRNVWAAVLNNNIVGPFLFMAT